MTSDYPVRRALARCCSTDTMTHLVDPILADMRWESGRPAWRGYLSLARALTVHAVLSVPGSARRVCSDDHHAVPKVAAWSLAAAILAAVPLAVWPFLNRMSFAPEGPLRALGWLLLPQGIILTLPASLLFAIPMALRCQPQSPRLILRIVALSLVWAALIIALSIWVLPAADHIYRARATGTHGVSPGTRGGGFTALSRQIELLRTFHGSESLVRRLEYAYHVRLALAGAAVPLGLLALCVARSDGGRRRPFWFGMAGLLLYTAVLFPFHAFIQASLLHRTAIPPAVLAWLPNLVVGLLAAVFLARNPERFDRPLTNDW